MISPLAQNEASTETRKTMKTYTISRFLKSLAIAATLPLAANGALDTNRVEQITGVKGAWSAAEGVFKVTASRNDVKIVVDGWSMPPFMGLASWAAFTEAKMGGVMVMGDTVLFQDEVNPAMSAALDNGLAVTALHNHFFYDEPKVYFMHIAGEGDAVALAAAVKKIQDKVKEIRAASPTPAKRFTAQTLVANSSVSPAAVEQNLGKGQAKDGMYK